MSFLHPEFLFLTPLLGVPILIHLLNRLRYRRVRWAAMEFLLTSERRAVRRARLKQLLLMMIRMLLLTCALAALAQPVFRGRIAALLGGSSQVAVVLDASASMSAEDMSGRQAFDVARALAARTIRSLPAGTSACAGTFAADYASRFAGPVHNHDAVAADLEASIRTDGPDDVPAAIRAAARSLERTGGGGTIWVLTDMRAAGWRASDTGLWDQVRRALLDAGRPRLLITDVSPNLDANLSIQAARLDPPVVVQGDAPALTVTVRRHGSRLDRANVTMVFDGKSLDTQVVRFDGAERTDCHFYLPQLTEAFHVCELRLAGDALPADDRHHLIIRTESQLPVLVVDGAPSSAASRGAAHYLALALEPPPSELTGRSPFSVRKVTAAEWAQESLGDYAAVFLADVPQPPPDGVQRLTDYLDGGGLLVVFPGDHTDTSAWNHARLLGAALQQPVDATPGEAFAVDWVSPTSPVVSTLPLEGLDAVHINRMFVLEPAEGVQVLARTAEGRPFLVRRQSGRGKVYTFAVSCQDDFSNLPMTSVFLITGARAVFNHLLEVGRPLAQAACTPVELALTPGIRHVRDPNGRVHPLQPGDDLAAGTLFTQTAYAGIYRMLTGAEVASAEGVSGTPVVAMNVPPAESDIERMDPTTVPLLLGGYPVIVSREENLSGRLDARTTTQSAASSFPLATMAVFMLLGGVMVAWSIGRPGRSSAGAGNETAGRQ